MEQWSAYLRLTEAMLALAQQKRWSELETLSAARLSMQGEGLSANHDSANVEILGRCLERCLALNRQIADLVDGAHEEKATELQRAQLGGQALAAYRSAERFAEP